MLTWMSVAWAIDPSPSVTAPSAAPGADALQFAASTYSDTAGNQGLRGSVEGHAGRWVWSGVARAEIVDDADLGVGLIVIDRPKLRVVGLLQNHLSLTELGWFKPGVSFVWTPLPTLRVDGAWGPALYPLNLGRPTWAGSIDRHETLPELGVSLVRGDRHVFTLRLANRRDALTLTARYDRHLHKVFHGFAAVELGGSLQTVFSGIRAGVILARQR